MIKGFKDFLLRGNVVDLAIAVVLGAAFGAVVNAFAQDVIGGLIGAIGGTPDFGDSGFALGGGKVVIGSTITALVNFVVVGATIYFVVVVPMQRLDEVRGRSVGVEADIPAPTDEAVLLTEIRDLLRAERRP